MPEETFEALRAQSVALRRRAQQLRAELAATCLESQRLLEESRKHLGLASLMPGANPCTLAATAAVLRDRPGLWEEEQTA
jgi:hypothetical protein